VNYLGHRQSGGSTQVADDLPATSAVSQMRHVASASRGRQGLFSKCVQLIRIEVSADLPVDVSTRSGDGSRPLALRQAAQQKIDLVILAFLHFMPILAIYRTLKNCDSLHHQFSLKHFILSHRLLLSFCIAQSYEAFQITIQVNSDLSE
jgi:hypothetical protein